MALFQPYRIKAILRNLPCQQSSFSLGFYEDAYRRTEKEDN